MKTISAKVTDEFYLLANKVSKENNISVSSMIKQAFESSKIEDKSIELKILNELHNLRNECAKISEYCAIENVVDKQVLLTLASLETSFTEIRETLKI